MSEVITETIIPGTYIEVRAEGLLSVGAIATGNVGVIGTAEMGGGDVQLLGSYEEGRARFGEPGAWDAGAGDDNLSLVRALRLLFDNGARTVYAQRVFDAATAKPAAYKLSNDANVEVLTLVAKTPGAWGNRLEIRVEEGEAQAEVVDEVIHGNGSFPLSAQSVLTPAAEGNGNGNGDGASIGKVVVRENGIAKRFQLKASPATASASVVQLNASDRTLTFAARPAAAAEVRASYWVPKEKLRKITLRFGNVQEVYVVPSVSYLAQLLGNNPSKLVDVVKATGNGLPRVTPRFEVFKDGANGAVTNALYQTALDNLVDRNVQIVVVAGRKFTDVKSAVLGHVEKTENLGRERIAVVGADSSDVAKVQENANDVANKRVVLVAPGLKQQDPTTGQLQELPPYFAAAAVAGKLSSVSPHISLTNKELAGIDGLAVDYNYGQLTSLVQDRVLVLQRKRGIRVVKGITTDDEAFKQISIRRVVDYVKEGTRQGANQYIGKLNNTRVRGNLKSTLDGFLSDLLRREFLTGYKLTVFADRPMEIRGEVLVTMDLMPTFSIDVIRVVMNLS
jgi:hypothetical protein